MEPDENNLQQAEVAYKDMYAKLYNVPRENLEDVSVDELEQLEKELTKKSKVQFKEIKPANTFKEREKIPAPTVTEEPKNKVNEQALLQNDSKPLFKSIESLPLNNNLNDRTSSTSNLPITTVSETKEKQKSVEPQKNIDNKSAFNFQPDTIPEISAKKESSLPPNKPIQLETNNPKEKEKEKEIKTPETLPNVMDKDYELHRQKLWEEREKKLKAATSNLAPPPSIDSKIPEVVARKEPTSPTAPINTNIPITNQNRQEPQLNVVKIQENIEPPATQQTPAPETKLDKVDFATSTTNIPLRTDETTITSKSVQEKPLPDWVTMPIKKADKGTEKEQGNTPLVETSSAPMSLPLGENVTEDEQAVINQLASKLDSFKQPVTPTASAPTSVPLNQSKQQETGATISDIPPISQPVLPTSTVSTNVPIMEPSQQVVGVNEQTLQTINNTVNELLKLNTNTSKEIINLLQSLKVVVEQVLSVIPTLGGNTSLSVQNKSSTSEVSQVNANFVNNYKNEIRRSTSGGVIDINSTRNSIPGFTI